MTSLKEPIGHPNWVYELKHNGFRGVLYVVRGSAPGCHSWLASQLCCKLQADDFFFFAQGQGLLQFYDIGEVDGRAFMVHTWTSPCTLNKSRPRSYSHGCEEDKTEIFIKICDA